MNNEDLIEFTPEGLKKVCDALVYLPKEQREMLVLETIKSVIRA